LDYDGKTKKKKEHFIEVDLDRILDIPVEEYQYNHRFLMEYQVENLVRVMVKSASTCIEGREMQPAANETPCMYDKPVLTLTPLYDEPYVDEAVYSSNKSSSK
jgi:hypothetical protein